jgi:DNA mismatch repair protein MutH
MSSSKEEHVAQLESLGFDCPMVVEAFAKMWKPLEDEGYEMYAMYTSADGSALEGNASCLICSTSASGLRWEKVITSSQNSAVMYSVCSGCDAQYVVDTIIRQKALRRLLEERNTRPT